MISEPLRDELHGFIDHQCERLVHCAVLPPPGPDVALPAPPVLIDLVLGQQRAANGRQAGNELVFVFEEARQIFGEHPVLGSHPLLTEAQAPAHLPTADV